MIRSTVYVTYLYKLSITPYNNRDGLTNQTPQPHIPFELFPMGCGLKGLFVVTTGLVLIRLSQNGLWSMDLGLLPHIRLGLLPHIRLGLGVVLLGFCYRKNRHEHLCMGSLGHGWVPFIVTTRLGSAGVCGTTSPIIQDLA